MRHLLLAPCLAAACGLAACAAEAPAAAAWLRHATLVDLSHPFDADTIFWPTEAGFRLERRAAGRTEQGFWYAANGFCTAEHGGTHLDAPYHFSQYGQTVDAIPLERLLGEAIVVDVEEAARSERDHAIDLADLLAFEAAQGRIPDDAIVLLRTGWAAAWPDRARYLGTDARGPDAVARLHFPGLHPEAAAWLVRERRVRAVGIDTASIDPGPSKDFGSHQVLAGAGVPIFENVDGLAQLPPRGAVVVALPMKIRGGTGGPLRLVALVSAER
jgi:kynurenine formamidase